MPATAASISAARDAQPIGRQRQPIEALGIAQQRRIALGAHIGDDRRHRLIDAFRGLARLIEQGGERGLEPADRWWRAGSLPQRGAEPGDPGADRLRLRLQRGAVDDQPRGDRCDHLDLHQAVGPQRRHRSAPDRRSAATGQGQAPAPSHRSDARHRRARRARRSGAGRCSDTWSPRARATSATDRRCPRSPPVRRPTRGRRRCRDRAAHRSPGSRTPSAHRRRRCRVAPRRTRRRWRRRTAAPAPHRAPDRRWESAAGGSPRRRSRVPGATPARARSWPHSARMRPFGSAMMSGAVTSGSSAAAR